MDFSDLQQILLPIACGVFFGMAALPFLLPMAKDLFRSVRSSGWSETSGVILEHQLIPYHGPTRTRGPYFYPEAVYEYQVGGQMYRGRRIAFGYGTMMLFKQEQAQAILENYPLGATVTVYYDPRDPQQAILKRG